MKNSLLSNRFLFGILLFVIVSMFAYSVFYTGNQVESNNEVGDSIARLEVNQLNNDIVKDFNAFFRDTGDDLLFLSSISSLNDYINGRSDLSRVHHDFRSFITQTTDYYQVRYVNEMGMEVVRYDYDWTDYERVPDNNLQDKSGRYYFEDSMTVGEGKIFLSPLDLNIEQKMLENRGTESDPVYVPVVRLGTPVFDNDNNPKGVVVINLYMDYLLDKVRRAERDGHNLYLVNMDGYYLANSDKSKEYAFMKPGLDDNLFSDYPELPKNLIKDFDKSFNGENNYYVFDYIYPKLVSFGLSDASDITNYYWVLVSVEDRQYLDPALDHFRQEHNFILLLSGVVNLFILFIAGLLAFRK